MLQLPLEALKRIQDEAYVVIRASEEWAESYKDAPVQWKDLIHSESRLQRNLRQHYREFAKQRVAGWVNWSEYQNRLALVNAAEVQVTITDDNSDYKAEQQLITAVVIDEIRIEMTQGILGAREIYTKWIGTATVNDLVSQAALDRAAELARGLNETTLSAVQKSIETSIRLGEDITKATARLQGIIDSPIRAEMIARTETVRAFQTGKHIYATQTGAMTKTWSAMPGADAGAAYTPCLDNADQDPIPVGADFSSGDPYPPAHPRCRCDVIYQYGDKTSDDPAELDTSDEAQA